MSDTSTQVDEGQQEGDPNLRILRDKAKRTDELEAGNLQLQRENALLKSGLDLESPVGQLFAKSYDGELTAEALKAEAEKYGVPIKGQAPAATETEVVEETTEPTGTAERSALSDGAPADTGEDKHPAQEAKEVYDRMMAEGKPQEEAAGAHFHTLVEAAMRGDKRVIVE